MDGLKEALNGIVAQLKTNPHIVDSWVGREKADANGIYASTQVSSLPYNDIDTTVAEVTVTLNVPPSADYQDVILPLIGRGTDSIFRLLHGFRTLGSVTNVLRFDRPTVYDPAGSQWMIWTLRVITTS